jgi:hypothetical protein
MARDEEPITQPVQDYFGGWYVCGAIASAVVRSAPCREYLHLMRTGGGWKIADALWLPR